MIALPVIRSLEDRKGFVAIILLSPFEDVLLAFAGLTIVAVNIATDTRHLFVVLIKALTKQRFVPTVGDVGQKNKFPLQPFVKIEFLFQVAEAGDRRGRDGVNAWKLTLCVVRCFQRKRGNDVAKFGFIKIRTK